MAKILLVYATMSGNTEAMADLIEKGLQEALAEVDRFEAMDIDDAQLFTDYDHVVQSDSKLKQSKHHHFQRNHHDNQHKNKDDISALKIINRKPVPDHRRKKQSEHSRKKSEYKTVKKPFEINAAAIKQKCVVIKTHHFWINIKIQPHTQKLR